MSSVNEFLKGIAKSWADQSWSVRLLRLWLGITFTYAGIDKALDGGFLNPDATTYIGKQLAGFAQQSPSHRDGSASFHSLGGSRLFFH